MGICHSYAPDGRCISLLKMLLTNVCIYDCLYCINRRSSSVPRARFTTEELVDLTISFYQQNVIEGLFLSSGIIRNADYTMEQVIEVARRLREERQFHGYIHLKTIPDASPELIARAGLYADRLSINIELPTVASLRALAPEKDDVQIKQSMARIRVQRDDADEASREAQKIRSLPGAQAAAARPPRFAPAGQSTQVIVGADASTDRQVLTQSAALYGAYKMRRVYYSAFSPIDFASPLLPSRAAPLVREHRLYQADWLVRFYGFSSEEIVLDGDMLSLEIDPKTAWALAHPEVFPVDLNRAPREMLLRVPGLGVRSVDKILKARRVRRVRRGDMTRLRVASDKVLAFVVLPDHMPRGDAATFIASTKARASRPSGARSDAQLGLPLIG